ncbi:MAG: hypothetical protein V3U24_05060 [Candidatus Neomarinimicrobiota bacterium]
MKRILAGMTALLVFSMFNSVSYAHGDIELHTTDRWDECSMQLDPSLTQGAWHQFTQEAGIMAVFNPLTSAKPLGKWNFDIVLTQGWYPIDDKDAAWNDTFVHPHSTHWLYGEVSDDPDQVSKNHAGSSHVLGLPLPMVRLGVSERMDVGFYYIPAPGANYSFLGGQLQYNFLNDAEKNLAAAVRVSAGQIGKIEDFDLSTYSVDVIGTKDILTRFSSYAGLSAYLVRSHETTSAVNLDNENVFGLQGNVGVSTLLFSHLKIGAQLTVGALTFPSVVLGFSR